MIFRFIRGIRARRKLTEAKSRVAAISRQIDANRKARKAFRPLLGSLADARRDMLRAEIEMGGR